MSTATLTRPQPAPVRVRCAPFGFCPTCGPERAFASRGEADAHVRLGDGHRRIDFVLDAGDGDRTTLEGCAVEVAPSGTESTYPAHVEARGTRVGGEAGAGPLTPDVWEGVRSSDDGRDLYRIPDLSRATEPVEPVEVLPVDEAIQRARDVLDRVKGAKL